MEGIQPQTGYVLWENVFNGKFSELQNFALIIYKETFNLMVSSQKVICGLSFGMY